MRLTLLVLLFGLTGCTSEKQSETTGSSEMDSVSFKIQIINEDREALSDSSVAIGGQQLTADSEGIAEVTVSRDRLYQLTFSASGHYSMTHTFSDQERISLEGQLPPVTLVEKKEGRVMLAFGGDTVVGRRYHAPNPGEPRYVSENNRLQDLKTLLTPIKPYLSLADYVSVNLESPVLEAEPEERSTKFVVFFY